MASLGCPRNLVDSEMILAQLQSAGFVLTDRAEEAEALLVNTCAFLRSAVEESIETILELSRYKKEGGCRALIVVGCLPQRYGEALAREMPEVDAWMGVRAAPGVAEICRRALRGELRAGQFWADSAGKDWGEDLPRILCTPPHFAYLRVAEGCDNRCSYCVVPSLRGGLRSRPLPSLLREAAELAEAGAKELILVAQDLGSYGRDLNPPLSLSILLRSLCRVEGLEWIRLLYVHPARVTEELVRVLAEEPRICPYLDLPVQHIDDDLLRAMNRGVSSARIRQVVEELRSAIPHIRLRTTVMVGFPGETEYRFATLLDFIREAQFDHLGAFAYSREEGTPAAGMKGQIKSEVKARRLREVMEVQAEISRRKNRALVGTRQRVLIDGKEGPSESVHWGRISGQAPEIDGAVQVWGKGLSPGQLVEVEIVGADTYDLVARCLV